MSIGESTVKITIPKWRVAVAHGFVFAAWTLGQRGTETLSRRVSAFLSRGTRVEFVRS